MNIKNYKKITYSVCIIALATVGYLSFIRKHSANDSATIRNAKFLGIKGSDLNSGISNQKDLTIDQTQSEEDNSKSSAEMANEGTGSTSKPATLYTVKEGDTYGCIAESYYGSYEHWPDILNANTRYGNGFSEYGLHVGAVLELPAIESLKPSSKLCS